VKTILHERFGRMDMGVFLAVLALLGFGVVLVYSSSFALAQDKFGGEGFFLSRQVVRVLIAIVCFMVFINVDYHVWGKLGKGGYIAALVLLLAVLVLPGSHAVNGARRWVALGPLSFQASEFARLALIVLIAARCDELGEQVRDFRRFVQIIIKLGVVCALVFVEPNFSTALIIGVLGLALLFVGGASIWHLSATVLSLIPVAVVGLLAAPYRRARLMSYLSGGAGKSAEHVGYQAQQALIGLGNGGLFGVGLGQGTQKYFYLPEPHTDFVFAILGEEIGLAGLLVVFAVFGFIVYRGFRIALHAPDRMGQVMAFGVTFMMALYVLVHASVNVGLMPTTGVPLPFLSYGGMSLILTMVSFGVLLNISSQTRRAPFTATHVHQLSRRRG
jgi:cell division protein FtsW